MDKVQLLGLDQFGMALAAFRRLRSQLVRVRVNLASFQVTPALARLPAGDRHPYLRRQAKRRLARLGTRYPSAGWEVDGEVWGIPMALEGRIAANQAEGLAREVGIQSVVVASIPGHKPRERPARSTWFCVRALVAIQIEGERAGMQTVEDRFVLVRASSPQDADRRLRGKWREYATPYLNSSGQLVRWQLERVTDVYETLQEDLDPSGVEVYSKLSKRRIRPERVWVGVSRGRGTTR